MTGPVEQAAGEGPGLYLHVPFCARACPYCDFDFVVGRDAGLAGRVDAWLAGLANEGRARADAIDELVERRGAFDTLYLGGGTPSLLSEPALAQLFEWLLVSFGVATDRLRECTIECNPEHVDERRLDQLVGLGVDRISLGVQTLSPTGLRQLGRVHDREQALASVHGSVARGLRTSVDLIVGWSGQREDELRGEIATLVDAGVEHVSVYALTIEAETPWPKLVRRGLRVLPDEDVQAELLAIAAAELEQRGFVHYEVASYARPGAEAVHNGKYWRWADVIGLGPSAASVVHDDQTVARTTNPRGLDAWLAGAAPERERLVGAQAAAEGLWLGLRRLDGLDVDRFLARFAVDGAWLDARIARQLEICNLVRSADGRSLAIAPGRWLWHDSVAVDVLSP